jgi:rare lipoprotein A
MGRLSSFRFGVWLTVMLLLGGCAQFQLFTHAAKEVSRPDEKATPGGLYKIGNPYQIDGIWYYPGEDYKYDETGIASWYGPDFHGKATANGEIYDMNQLTAAHRTLPMPSLVRVTNLENGRSLILRVNDRGPFAKGRIIDVSRRGAQLLGFHGQGTARVRVQILAEESRQLAMQMKGQGPGVRDGSLIVDNVAKPSVTAEALPPPGSNGPGSVRDLALKPTVVASRDDVTPVSVAPPSPPVSAFALPKESQLTVEAVRPTSIFIQAGAYSRYDNAERVRGTLAGVGKARVVQALVNGRDIYRVRVGPLDTVDAADSLLERVVRAGFTDARIVVD